MKAPNSSHDAGQSTRGRMSASWETRSMHTSLVHPRCCRRLKPTTRSGEAPCLRWSNPFQSASVTETECCCFPLRTTTTCDSDDRCTCGGCVAAPGQEGADTVPWSCARSCRADDDDVDDGMLLILFLRAFPEPCPSRASVPPPSLVSPERGCKGRPRAVLCNADQSTLTTWTGTPLQEPQPTAGRPRLQSWSGRERHQRPRPGPS